MSKHKKYEDIEAYLAGKLTKKERTDFESELNDNPDLANEVELHQKVETEIGDSTKRELRGILKDLKKQYAEEKSSENVVQLRPRRNLRKILAIAASVLILASAFWYFLSNDSNEEQQMVQEETIQTEEPKSIENPQELAEESSTPNPSDSTPENPSEKANPTEINTLENENTPSEKPSLNPFEVNPDFENLIAGTNASPHEFEIEFPEPEAKLTLRDGKAQFGLLGTLFTAAFPEKEPFVLKIFDNQSNPFTNDQPIFRIEMDFEKNETERDLSFAGEERDIYYFNFRERISVKPGLYYWMVSLEKSDDVVSSGKFFVNAD